MAAFKEASGVDLAAGWSPEVARQAGLLFGVAKGALHSPAAVAQDLTGAGQASGSGRLPNRSTW
ncbi:MAG: hypothetical protein ACRDYB_02530 [Acidimicrobiales bacterium]